MATIIGGDKVEAVLKGMAKKLAAGTLRVGFLEGATYPNGTSLPMVAAIQEFGAPKVFIPPRPYFRNMVAAKSPQWPAAVAKLLKSNSYDADLTLRQMGHGIKGQLQQSIVDTNAPPLSPTTVMLRKMKSDDQSLVVTRRVVNEARRRVAAGMSTGGASRKPLIDSGDMRNGVDFEVSG